MLKHLKALFSSWYYMALNMYYFVFCKKWVDNKIEEYLLREYNDDDIIVVGVHGIFEYYWQSLVRYMKYFDEQGKVFIPIGYNFFDENNKTIDVIKKQLDDIHSKTGAKIVIIGNSSGAVKASEIMYKHNSSYIQELVPLASIYAPTRGVAFWWYWIAPDSKKTINDQFEKPNKVPIPKTKISLYGKYDAFVIPRTASIC
ncbi:MAG: hypothetical protein ABH828_06010, partial [archaeon]